MFADDDSFLIEAADEQCEVGRKIADELIRASLEAGCSAAEMIATVLWEWTSDRIRNRASPPIPSHPS